MKSPPRDIESGAAWRDIAWKGIALPVPADWDLSGYRTVRKVERILLEDMVAVRARIEWVAAKENDAPSLRQAYARRLGRSRNSLRAEEPIEDFPKNWLATQRRLDGGGFILTALSIQPGFPFHGLLRLYGGASDPARDWISRLRVMVEGMRFYTEAEPIPWRVFDLAVRVPGRFELTETSFLAGRKMMGFSYRLRRLWIWRLSLLNRLLRNQSAAEVLAELLNRQKSLAGVRFVVESGDRLVARRRALHPFGLAEEIGRGCFRYRAEYRLDPANNAMLAYVYQYRGASDLAWLEGLILLDDTRVSQRPR